MIIEFHSSVALDCTWLHLTALGEMTALEASAGKYSAVVS